MRSKFKVGWVLVMFDLPVGSQEQRRLASRFRLDLLDLGFFMMQESVYARNCVSMDKYRQFLLKVRLLAPEEGNVTGLFITNKQWLDSVRLTLVKPTLRSRQIANGEPPHQQLMFW
ncbi:MAG: CRISPR-associated endonuclease Cas2 [Vampirovibrionales bacterium]|nr:CRISPR-associated endonuclease Cas2 [Vampirovibrionales bacterium]